MIPFEADPGNYIFAVICLIGAVVFAIMGIGAYFISIKNMCCFFAAILTCGAIVEGVIIYTSSSHPSEFVVCNHVDNLVVGENQDVYVVYDSTLKLKIKDGQRISVAVVNSLISPYPKIYKIDTPFVCNISGAC